MHWQHMTLTEAEMAKTVMIQARVELALMCARMFPEESDKIEKYVGGLPDMIHESVIAATLKNHARDAK
ncbi:hypothetical protein Tco_0222247 [Tanacetum coccineum]